MLDYLKARFTITREIPRDLGMTFGKALGQLFNDETQYFASLQIYPSRTVIGVYGIRQKASVRNPRFQGVIHQQMI